MTRKPDLNEVHARALSVAEHVTHMLTRRGVLILSVNPNQVHPEIEIEAPYESLKRFSRVVIRKSIGAPARTVRMAELQGAHVIWSARS